MFSCILSGTDTHILFFGYLAYLISFLQFSGPFRQFSLLHSKKCLLKNIILLVPKIKQKKRKQKQHQNIMKQPNVIRRLIFLFFFPLFFLFFYSFFFMVKPPIRRQISKKTPHPLKVLSLRRGKISKKTPHPPKVL
jgi:hypothetical protein